MRYAAFILSAMLVVPAGVAARSDPPVRLKLSERTLDRGQNEKIRVKAAADGYLLVLRTDTQGRVRILFPLNPTDSDAIRGGRQVEIRGRGDRDAFTALGEPGTGAVLAAWSGRPFQFHGFATHGHWTRAGLVADSAGSNAEGAMLAVVDRMSDGHYEYDVMRYRVGNREYHRGYARMYDRWYDPWYGPWNDAWIAPWSFAPQGGWAWYPFSYDPRFFGPAFVPEETERFLFSPRRDD